MKGAVTPPLRVISMVSMHGSMVLCSVLYLLCSVGDLWLSIISVRSLGALCTVNCFRKGLNYLE